MVAYCKITPNDDSNWLDADTCTVEELDDHGKSVGTPFKLPVALVDNSNIPVDMGKYPEGAVFIKTVTDPELLDYLKTARAMPSKGYNVKLEKFSSSDSNITASLSDEGPGPIKHVEISAVRIEGHSDPGTSPSIASSTRASMG